MTSIENPILKYAIGLGEEHLELLYETTASCMVIYRFLPPLSQQFVARLAFVTRPIPEHIFASWVNSGYDKEGQFALRVLLELRIVLRLPDSNGLGEGKHAVILSPKFQQSFQCGLTGVHDIADFPDASSLVQEKYRKTPSSLQSYASERWESLLQFLALPSEETQKAVSAEMRQLLAKSEFVREPNKSDSEELEITSLGFQFLLMDRHTQMWTYLIRYLKNVDASKGPEEAVKCLSLIFRLSFCSSLHPFKCDQPDTVELMDTILHLRELGLIFMRKRKDGWFYASPLVKLLRETEILGSDGTNSEGCMVIETNFRVYAYTDSMLELAILSSFSEMTYRFGNMAVGLLTRDAARKAFQVGIKAQQIIDYLRSKARKSLSDEEAKKPPLMPPPSVSDQLRLWELERDRFTFDAAVYYCNFDTIEDFERVRDFAKHRGILQWENSDERRLVVHEGGHEAVRKFYKQMKGAAEQS